MRRVLVVCVVIAVVVSVIVAAVVTRRQSDVASPEPVAVHFSDLAPAVYKGGKYRGQTVRIAYPHRLKPTADPLVWEFFPGSDSLPPTHRLHFSEPPDIRTAPVVVGTVDGISPDMIVRANNVPGVVVITSARVVPRASP